MVGFNLPHSRGLQHCTAESVPQNVYMTVVGDPEADYVCLVLYLECESPGFLFEEPRANGDFSTYCLTELN